MTDRFRRVSRSRNAAAGPARKDGGLKAFPSFLLYLARFFAICMRNLGRVQAATKAARAQGKAIETPRGNRYAIAGIGEQARRLAVRTAAKAARQRRFGDNR